MVIVSTVKRGLGFHLPVEKLATAFENAVGEIVTEANDLGVSLDVLCKTAGVSRTTFWRLRKVAPPQLVQIDTMRRELKRERLRQRRGGEA